MLFSYFFGIFNIKVTPMWLRYLKFSKLGAIKHSNLNFLLISLQYGIFVWRNVGVGSTVGSSSIGPEEHNTELSLLKTSY